MSIEIDATAFLARLEMLHKNWQKNKEADWGNADAICIPIPKFDEEDDGNYAKTTALSRYLLGYEFNSTVLVLTRTELHVLAAEKKIKLLEPLQVPGKPVKLVFHSTTKDDKNAGNFADLVRAIKGSHTGTRLGLPLKDCAAHGGVEGNLASVWLKHASDKAGLATVEVVRGLASVMAVKDKEEVECLQKAAVMSNKTLKHGFVKKMEEVFQEEGKTVTHSSMADHLNSILEKPSVIGVKVKEDTIEPCYFPIVQSGGSTQGYNIKPSAVTDDGTLTEDVVVVSLGARFKSYCANVARTYVIDPVPKVEKTYHALVRLQSECLGKMVPGAKLSEVHDTAKAFLAQRFPHLSPHLPKSLGFSLGLDFKDSVFVLTGKVDPSLRFKANMVFNLAVGFQDVALSEQERSKAKGSISQVPQFSMLLADTVKISAEGPADVLTKAPKDWNDVSFTIKEEDDDEDEDEEGGGEGGEDEEDDEGVQVKTAAGKATVLKSRLRERSQMTEDQMESKTKRAEKQQWLMDKMCEKGRKLTAKNGGTGMDDDDAVVASADDFEAYKSAEQFPYEAKGSAVHIDMEREAVFLPISGQPVPFHISTVKNVTLPDPDKATYLRLNFYTPGQTTGKECAPQMAAIVNKHKLGTDQVFVKEFTFRSQSAVGLSTAYRLIQELRKRVRARVAKQEQDQDLVVQAKLVKLKDMRVPRLADIEMRPALGGGRKSKGTLDAHTNGLRFTAGKTGEHVDMMYSNVKHAFFQPCQSEHIVLVHFHLKHPIMVGKKKCVDVQFITEVVEASEDVGARGSVYDPDEIESEQRERKMRKAMNKKFQEYTVKVEEVAHKHGFESLEFDIPYRDLAFQGTPHREMVMLQPSVHCLVNLTETPAFVISMSTVEHVHFERCTMGSRNFDMVYVFKNYETATRMVSAVDMKDLDDLQEWLTQQDITYTMGTINFNWKQMMEHAKDFMKDGVFWEEHDEDGEPKDPGWLFLNAEGAADDDGDGEDDEDEEEYRAAPSAEEESSDDDDDDDDDDDSFDDEDDDEDSYDEEEEGEAEGEDWGELEAKAKASDRARDTYDDEEDKKMRKDAPPAKKSKTRR